jgi:hypothetical protein
MQRQNDAKYIVSIPNGGLCNRLKCLISSLRIGERLQRNFFLYWPVNALCGSAFSHLFQNSFSQIDISQLRKIIRKGNWEYYSDSIDSLRGEKEYILLNTWRYLLFPEEIPENFATVYPNARGNDIDFEFGRIPFHIRKEIISFVDTLKPVDNIEKIINEYMQKYDFSNTVGIHIRRADFLSTFSLCVKISSNEKYIHRMHEIISNRPDVQFFLSTDCEKTEKEFLDIFGRKIFVFPKENRNRDNPNAIREALIDLLLLSKTGRILGTYMSTFNEMAWWFGGCKSEVEIIGENETEMKRKVLLEKKRKKLVDSSDTRKVRKYLKRRLKTSQ